MPPPTVTPIEPKQQRSVATRQRILDAAVEVLLDSGPAGLTTSAVAERARITRGAQQHHFSRREVLLAEAVRHLSKRQIGELRDQIAAVPRGRGRVNRALDAIFELYNGPLFTATLELALAAQHTPELRPLVTEHEKTINRETNDAAQQIFEPSTIASADFAARWAMALGTARGLALLRLLGHPPEAVDRQWRVARTELTKLLAL